MLDPRQYQKRKNASYPRRYRSALATGHPVPKQGRGIPVAMQRHAPTMMQRGSSRGDATPCSRDATPGSHDQRDQRIMSLTSLSRSLWPCKTGSRTKSEESVHGHLAPQLARGSSYSHEVNIATSRQVECQLPEWRTLAESESDTKKNWKVFGRALRNMECKMA